MGAFLLTTMASIMEPQMPAEMLDSLFCQEIGQAFMWLGCAFLGWIASSFVLEYLGCKKGLKASKARAGSDAFRQEVVQYTSKTGISAAAKHFGLTETEVKQYNSCCETQQLPETVTAEADNGEEAQSAMETPLRTAPSTNAGHVLLEHYDVFQPGEGAWSGPLEEQIEVEEEAQSSLESVERHAISLSALQEVNAEQFFEGSDSISLWLVPDGHIYYHHAQTWVPEEATM